MLRLLPFIGPLVGIFKSMTKKIVVFLLFFLLELWIFTIFAHLIFQYDDEFTNIYDAFIFLVPVSIGNFDFDEIQESRL